MTAGPVRVVPPPEPGAVRADSMFVAEMRRRVTEKRVAADEAGLPEDDEEDVVMWHQGSAQLRVQNKIVIQETNEIRVRSNGHWWLTRDKDAGTRAYLTNKRLRKFWHGYYSQIVVDHFTRLPMAIRLFPADRNESEEYPAIYEMAKGYAGKDPTARRWRQRVILQSHLRVQHPPGGRVGVPDRRQGTNLPLSAQRGDTFDEHGVPECPHCKGLTDFVRFAIDKNTGRPRMWVRCAFPLTDKCEKEQAISCSRDWRRLLPVWRTHPGYEAMTDSHETYEGKHAALRSNYLIGPNSVANRPCRVGIAWHQLGPAARSFWNGCGSLLQCGLGAVRCGSDPVGAGCRPHRQSACHRLGLVGGGIIGKSRPPRRKPKPGEPVAA